MEPTMEMRTVNDAKRNAIVRWLDDMDAMTKAQMPMVQLPHANDTWMALARLRQHIEQCRHFVAVRSED